jgi:hypothetical protein
MPPDFYTSQANAQFNASVTQPMTAQPDPSATQPMGSQPDASATHLLAQFNASAPPPMTPHQRLTILLQPKSPTEILLSQSPHQNGVNWVFHDQATGQL